MSFTDPDSRLEITDPRMLRALAHPARMAIMQHLVLEGPATATECAEVAGLSPSACSYHLRALSRFGLVEEDPSGGADRRYRPWRARVIEISFSDNPDQPAAFRAASQRVMQTLQASSDEVKAQYAEREPYYPPEWQAVAGGQRDVLHVTAAELREIREQIQQIIAAKRRLRREDQPPGAGGVAVIVDFTPWFTPEQLDKGERR